MAERSDEQLPPLGEPTPAPPRRPDGSGRWYGRAPVVGVAGLLVGVLIGVAPAWIVSDGDDNDAAVDDVRVERTLPATTTTAVTVPGECMDAMRAAQQALTVLDEGLQSLRRLQTRNLERTLTQLDRLRQSLGERVRECFERA